MASRSIVTENIDVSVTYEQKPGTSGLRKKVSVFKQPHYTEVFIQSIFSSLSEDQKNGEFVIGGDGRYYSPEAIQIILRIAAGNGIPRVAVGRDGILSTPAASHLIRSRNAKGGLLLTASHNPAGPDGDFGLLSSHAGTLHVSPPPGPAQESVTNEVARQAALCRVVRRADLPAVDLSRVGTQTLGSKIFGEFQVDVIDPVLEYRGLLHTMFDMEAIRSFLTQRKVKVLVDSMHAVTGAYTPAVFCEDLGLPASSLVAAQPMPDFNGEHPDPNQIYAKRFFEAMMAGDHDIGFAFDGDGDRCMVMGRKFFVTPSDSLAVVANNWTAVKLFREGGFAGVARSMPTSAAVDMVKQGGGLVNNEGQPAGLYETPTGWKYFGSLLDAGKVSLCGEESFGMGCNAIREKDGIFAAIAWLSILEARNRTSQAAGGEQLCSVETIVRTHWEKFGRNVYTRYDYENVDAGGANQMMQALLEKMPDLRKTAEFGQFTLTACDEYTYVDPIDKSVSEHQGLRFMFSDGSRIMFRLSGTGSVGATVRLYIDRYVEPARISEDPKTLLKPLVVLALEWARLEEFLHRDKPTVIT